MDRASALQFLNSLLGQRLCYGLKSPDTDLYDFGLGQFIKTYDFKGNLCEVSTHTLHATCRFKIISRSYPDKTNIFDEESDANEFDSHISNLIGLPIVRVALSEKNDLWLDFHDYWMVFATFEDGEESWRYFLTNDNSQLLVASNVWLRP